MTDHPSWYDLITECFQSTNFMALSTEGSEGLWVNPVYFAWDKNFNLYFISELDCVHMRNIQSSSNIACAIYATNQDDFVRGSYTKGRAEIVSKEHPDWKTADKTYYDRVYPNDADLSQRTAPDSYRNKESWHLVKISIDDLSYFDTRYFEENRVAIPLNELIK